MEAKYKSVSISDFQERFPDDESCLKYLTEKKWENGFKCLRCGHDHYCEGRKKYYRQCTSCRYQESPTANTLFHKVKFSLQKAFTIVYFISTNKKGISSTELSRKLQLRQKTCWLFRLKVLQAMRSKKNVGLFGRVEVSDFEIGHKRVAVNGNTMTLVKQVIIGIEKWKKGVSHIYAKVTISKSGKEILNFANSYIQANTAIKCYGNPGYRILNDIFIDVKIVKKSKGQTLPLSNRVSKGLKAWLRGMHGHAELMQYYLDEYCYRFNRNRMKEEIFDHLLERMVDHPPRTYKDIITYAPISEIINKADSS